MSPYISRLQRRFAAEAQDGASPGAPLEPFVRSRSPIAKIDQRLGIDERLGDGLGGLEPGALDEGAAESPAPERSRDPAPMIQRKPLGAPSLASLAPVPVAAPGPSPSASSDAPSTGAGPRESLAPERRSREALDPASLFDPLSRYFDESEAFPAPAAANTPLSPRAGERGPTPVSTPTPVPVSTPTAASRVSEAPASTGSVSRRATLTPTPTSRAAHVQPSAAPWREVLVSTPTSALAAVNSLDAIDLLGEAPAPEPRLYIAPRQREPAPFIADPGPTPAPALARPELERPAPRVEPQSSQRAAPPTLPRLSGAAQKLTIDSISQIGPLDRHFPNRRRSWRRYR